MICGQKHEKISYIIGCPPLPRENSLTVRCGEGRYQLPLPRGRPTALNPRCVDYAHSESFIILPLDKKVYTPSQIKLHHYYDITPINMPRQNLFLIAQYLINRNKHDKCYRINVISLSSCDNSHLALRAALSDPIPRRSSVHNITSLCKLVIQSANVNLETCGNCEALSIVKKCRSCEL